MKVLAAVIVCAVLIGCSKNNLLLGEVHANFEGHPATVTDCYRTSVPQPDATTHTWEPCRDSRLVLANGELQVNGRRYGTLNPGEPVVVDHGVVSAGGRQLQPH